MITARGILLALAGAVLIAVVIGAYLRGRRAERLDTESVNRNAVVETIHERLELQEEGRRQTEAAELEQTKIETKKKAALSKPGPTTDDVVELERGVQDLELEARRAH